MANKQLPRRNLTPDILQAHADGLVVTEIARKVGCSPANVSKMLSSRGIRPNYLKDRTPKPVSNGVPFQ